MIPEIIALAVLGFLAREGWTFVTSYEEVMSQIRKLDNDDDVLFK